MGAERPTSRPPSELGLIVQGQGCAAEPTDRPSSDLGPPRAERCRAVVRFRGMAVRNLIADPDPPAVRPPSDLGLSFFGVFFARRCLWLP